jgi:5-(carboxyamino)imidazole ribonucleotide synthase
MINHRVLPGATIGILGGGQLGRMMAISAKEMGYRIAVLEPKSDSPCGQVADHKIISAYDDVNGAKELANISDVITYEFENIDRETANWLEEYSYLPQGYRLLEVTQDREFEKKAVGKSGVDVTPFAIVNDKEDLHRAVEEIGFPSVLKTCRGGYDGKGQMVLRSDNDLQQALTAFVGKQKAILEQWIPFEKEISVIVTRSVSGETKTFPIAENIHRDNILHKTIVPAQISGEINKQATSIAIKLAEHLELRGTLAVEMFVTDAGDILVNELAPRPHNSGHFSIDACETSQFQQHIRAICNWPLGETTLLKPAVMINLLGEHLEKAIASIDHFSDVKLHLYGKDEAKPKRKMGHITILANSVGEALEKADKLAFITKTEEKL